MSLFLFEAVPVSGNMKNVVKTKTYEEFELFGGARRTNGLFRRPGVAKRIKAGYRRRVRRSFKQHLPKMLLDE